MIQLTINNEIALTNTVSSNERKLLWDIIIKFKYPEKANRQNLINYVFHFILKNVPMVIMATNGLISYFNTQEESLVQYYLNPHNHMPTSAATSKGANNTPPVETSKGVSGPPPGNFQW